MRLFPRYLLLLLVSTLLGGSLAAVIGVDYGQNNIKAMVVSPQAPLEIVLTPESKRKDISGLAIKNLPGEPGAIERIYGAAVGSIATRFPKNTLLHLKSILGKSIDDELDVTHYLKEHPGVNLTSTERNTIGFGVDGVEYPVEELVAMNLQEIVNRANLLLKEKDSKTTDKVTQLAITVPEFFNQYQRNALLDAGAITTDISKTYLVGDGMSIAINFALKHRDFTPGEPNYYIIYDMGSGSVKSSLISIIQPLNETEPLQIELGGYGYDSHFGGSSFTLAIADLITNKFLSKHPKIRTATINTDPKAVAKINQAAEKAKMILSANSEASVSIESLINDIDFRTTITRLEFEEYVEDILTSVIEPIEESLESQLWNKTIGLNDLSGVILAGGSQRIPIVQQQLIDFVGEKKLLRSVNADEAAVNGITIRGVKLFDAFKTKPLDIIDRSIYSYSIEVPGNDSQQVIIPRGSVYPYTTSLIVNTTNEVPEDFEINLKEDGNLLKNITVKGSMINQTHTTKKCPNGVAYNVTFSLSQNRLFGIDKVEAICLKKPLDFLNPEANTGTIIESFNIKLNKENLSTKLKFEEEDKHINEMTFTERFDLRYDVKVLNRKDVERFELHEAKNILEGRLYDARTFLEDTDVIKKGPKTQVDQLSKLVPVYLEWLEEEADSATKDELSEKINEVNALKDKIEFYIKTASEPLDHKQFSDLLRKAETLLGQIVEHELEIDEILTEFNETYSKVGYDIRKEYAKIKLPRYLINALEGWNTTRTELSEAMSAVESIIKSKKIKKMSREDLFELKLAIDESYSEIEETLKFYKKSLQYRVNELEALYQRKIRAQKRKEDKLKKKLEEQKIKSSNGTNATNSTESEFDSGMSDDSVNIESTTTQTIKEKAPLHDEL